MGVVHCACADVRGDGFVPGRAAPRHDERCCFGYLGGEGHNNLCAGTAYATGSGVSDSRHRGTAVRSRHLRSEEHTSELQSRLHLVCRLLLLKKKKIQCNEVGLGPGGTGKHTSMKPTTH